MKTAYDGRLTFEEEGHVYRWDGNVVPSVTQILDGITEFRCSPEVLAAAAERGTDVHTACELEALGKLDYATVTEEVWPYLNAWLRFREEMKPAIEATEDLLYHELFCYAGQRDLRIAYRAKESWTVDIKTSATESIAWPIQTAAYALADTAHGNQLRRAVLMLGKDGRYKWREYKDLNDQKVFICLKTIRDWKIKHA